MVSPSESWNSNAAPYQFPKPSAKTSIIRHPALYDNLAQNEELARQLDQSIRQTKKDGWRGNKIKEREVKYAISEHLLEESEVDRIFTIVRNQSDY